MPWEKNTLSRIVYYLNERNMCDRKIAGLIRLAFKEWMLEEIGMVYYPGRQVL